MLDHKYFTDAFVLHDRTNFYPFLEKMLLPIRENKPEMDYPVKLSTNKVECI